MITENLVGQGELAVEDNWYRNAVDMTHYQGDQSLSMVDCGPSRSLWSFCAYVCSSCEPYNIDSAWLRAKVARLISEHVLRGCLLLSLVG